MPLTGLEGFTDSITIRFTVGSGNLTGKPILHILTKLIVRCELGHLGTLGLPVSVPLSVRSPILQLPRLVALRRSSLEIVDGDRPNCRAMARTPTC